MGHNLGTENWVAKGGNRMARGCRSWEMRGEEGSGCCVSSWKGTAVYKWDQEVDLG